MVDPEFKQLLVESADGTRIAVEVSGSGIPLVVVPGSLGEAADWRAFAAEIGDAATVYAIDRRAHGASGQGGPHSIEREYEDLAAVRAAVGADAIVFGHSYGAVVALGQALIDPPRALIVYEPPLPASGPIAGDLLVTYEKAISEGRLDDAMVLGLVNFVGVPEELIPQMREVLPWDHLVSLTPTWSAELHAIDNFGSDLTRFGALDFPVLELIGEFSPPRLVDVSRQLAEVLPNVTVHYLVGEGHTANATAPGALAAAVRSFVEG
jgi:pimeloyl-ACP methyl ester carboxylesterase